MPFDKSSSTQATKKNFHEFRHGKSFSKDVSKFGKKKAVKIMDAAVLGNQKRMAKKGK